MNSKERHEARYLRRKARREAKLHERQKAVGALAEAMRYSNLYNAGKAACKGVRWKTSTINFELRIFSRTARTHRRLMQKKWRSKKPCTFMLTERGHLRKIDAPHIEDRQVHKAFCRYVLRPLYYPHMIYDNGASMENKGFSFAINRLISFLRRWYRLNGTDGYAVSVDFKGYFPNAPHKTIEGIHDRLIADPDLRELADYLLNVFGPIGMALGVETSQTEAGILPNRIDHTMKDHERVKCLERYMDDTSFLVKTKEEAAQRLDTMREATTHEGLIMNEAKTHVTPLTGWFRYCQWRFHMTDSGGLVIKPSRRSVTNMHHKLNAFKRLVDKGEMTIECVCNDYNCWKAYVKKSNCHNILLKANRHFYRLFGFYPN